MTNDDLSARCVAALSHGFGVALALTIEDLILYDHLHAPTDDPVLDLLPYTAGVSTILFGYTAIASRRDDPTAAVEAWIIALCGGAAITIARAIRRRYQTTHNHIAARNHIAGQAAGGRYAFEAFQRNRTGDQ